MKTKIVLVGFILFSLSLFTACAEFTNPITDAVGLTHVRQDKVEKENAAKRKQEISYEQKCANKKRAWGTPDHDSRDDLLAKVYKDDPPKDPVFISLPYKTIFCATKDDLINFEKALINTRTYRILNFGHSQTYQIVGTQCYELDFAYTAVGLKLDEMAQGKYMAYKVIWENEETPYPWLQTAWVSQVLNSWIIEYSKSDEILLKRQEEYRQRVGASSEPYGQYKDLQCEGNDHLYYQDRMHTG